MRRISLTLVLGVTCLAGAAQELEFNPRTVVNRPFEAITEFPVVSASAIDLAENELVLGVEVNGEARAYPINMLTGPRREIINDTLGGVPIAATW